jgi:hypothetical protein
LNYTLLAAAEHHTAFLNTLQTAILYDLCLLADESGDTSKLDFKRLSFRWRIHETTLRNMLRELEHAGLIEYTGQRAVIKDSILKCVEDCKCPYSPVRKTASLAVETLTTQEVPKLDTKTVMLKRLDLSAPPNPNSVNGIHEKLKSQWRRRWSTAPAQGYIERALAEPIKAILQQTEGVEKTLLDFERAFANYLEHQKDVGFLNLPKFASSWGFYVNPPWKNTTQLDAIGALAKTLEKEL